MFNAELKINKIKTQLIRIENKYFNSVEIYTQLNNIDKN